MCVCFSPISGKRFGWVIVFCFVFVLPTSALDSNSNLGIFEQAVDWGEKDTPPQCGIYKVPGSVNVTGIGSSAIYEIAGNGDHALFKVTRIGGVIRETSEWKEYSLPEAYNQVWYIVPFEGKQDEITLSVIIKELQKVGLAQFDGQSWRLVSHQQFVYGFVHEDDSIWAVNEAHRLIQYARDSGGGNR